MNVELFDDGSALLQMRRSASKDDFREVCLTAAQVKQRFGDGFDDDLLPLDDESDLVTLTHFDAAAHFTRQGDLSAPPDTGL